MPASALQQRIIARIQQQGAITFAEYMRMALYEPGYGYYVSGPARMGWEGDYYTSTDVADFFAHCVGRQLRQLWEELGRPPTFTVLEQGAGRGDLATAVRRWATLEATDFSMALDYQAEDINAGQNALTLSSETGISPQGNVSGEALRGTSTDSDTTCTQSPVVFLSNELVDAFPVHIVQKQGERLYEVYVAVQDGLLTEVLGEPGSPEVAGYLDAHEVPWRTYEDGWRAEINLDALSWLRQTAQRLSGPDPKRGRPGFILAIDYGDSADRLYTPERHYGTLTCYYRHQLTDQPLVRPGEQDLTAHVNFTALIDEAREYGLHLRTFTTQREWLTALGIYAELDRIRQSEFSILDSDRASDKGQVALLQWYNLRQRVSLLTEPTGMGNFKVLILKS
ncbi:MAG: SAM-dependent methyltransferase [Ktedonobacteraceae bacterium]